MDVLEAMEGQGHEQVAFFFDRDTGMRCIIAVHDTTLGPGLGGARMWPFATEAEALTDVLRLSQAMTYKNAMAGLAYGGAKAVIMADPAREKTPGLLRAYARAADSLGGRYITAEDVGTTPEDMEIVMQETRWMLGKPVAAGGSGDSAPMTAFGVYQAMRACMQEAFGAPSLEGRTVAMQGFGKVASSLAGLLKDAGALLIVAEVREQARERARREFGARIAAVEDIYDAPCDVFSPCALGGVLNQRTIARLRCRVVAGAANNQLLEEADASRLGSRGIVYAPDYVANAGGVINLSCETPRYDAAAARTKTAQIFETTLQTIATAKRGGISTAEAANRVAEARLTAAREARDAGKRAPVA